MYLAMAARANAQLIAPTRNKPPRFVQRLQEANREELENVVQLLARVTSFSPPEVKPRLDAMLERLVKSKQKQAKERPFYETATLFIKPPSVVQRDFQRIISEIGTPARSPKTRSRSVASAMEIQSVEFKVRLKRNVLSILLSRNRQNQYLINKKPRKFS